MRKTQVIVAALVCTALAAGFLARPQVASANEPAKKDIVDTAVAAGNFKTLAAALKAAGVPATGYVYEKANHGFHNDTTPRYDKAAAELSWQRTLDFFGKYLKG